jgi:hypothetical protein
MKKEDLEKAITMLQSQLSEEEENYMSALKHKKKTLELINIMQRINSLRNMLHDISHHANLPLKKPGIVPAGSKVLLN